MQIRLISIRLNMHSRAGIYRTYKPVIQLLIVYTRSNKHATNNRHKEVYFSFRKKKKRGIVLLRNTTIT